MTDEQAGKDMLRAAFTEQGEHWATLAYSSWSDGLQSERLRRLQRNWPFSYRPKPIAETQTIR